MVSDPSLFDLIAADMKHFVAASADFQAPRATLLRQVSILLTPPLICCVFIRLAHRAHVKGRPRLARALALLNALIHKVEVDPASSIGPGLYIPHPTGVVFRGNAGRNLTLFSASIVGPVLHLPTAPGALAHCPTLGDNVTIGARATVVGPITVGDQSRIGPHAIVSTPVPGGTVLVALEAIGRLAPKCSGNDPVLHGGNDDAGRGNVGGHEDADFQNAIVSNPHRP